MIKELISTKERRYAIDLGEYSPGIRCIASPILGFNNTCVAAISISMLENHSQDKVDELAQGLLECTKSISQRLGSTDPTAWVKMG